MKNLVFIIADQLSRSILLPFCNKDYGFEALKQLAEHGIIATKYHTPSAVCTPSRGCILTGLTPFRHGAYRNGKNIGMDVKGCASVLKDNGYDVSYIGKWHLGKNRQMGDSLKNDNLLGFSFIGPEVEIGHAKSISKDGKTLFATIQENEEYTTDYLTRNAISYIDKACKSPFALFISYPDPHQPYLVRKPYSNMYAPYEMSIPETFYQEKLPDWAEEDEWGRQHYFPLSMFERKEYFQSAKAQYLGEVKCIDDSISLILDTLEKKDLLDNTTIVFTSDHGDYLGQHGLMEKNNLYDDVYSPPLFIMDKRLSGTMDSPMSAEDLMITLFSLCGISTPYFPGEDLSRCFLYHEDKYKDLFIYPSDVPRAGIITDEYKLCFVGKSWDGKKEFKDHILFSRKNDKAEQNNLFEKYKNTSIVTQLASRILDKMKKENVPSSLLPPALYHYSKESERK